MATFNERIQVVIDVVTDKATKGFKDFRTAVGEAEGFTGKLKAGVSSLGGVFGAATSGPVAMGAAVVAAGKFAADAVTDYANLGVQVADFAAATGTTTEAASRLIEVTGDLGISTDALQSTLGKLNKSIDPKLFDDLGVSIAHTSSGAVDVNGTFLNVIDRLRAIKDPAEQARVGAQLLGKGWQSVAPLIARSAKDIKDQLAGVSDVKVFSKEDTDKAQKFDKAMKDLSDATQELALKLGEELLPVVTNTLGPLGDLAGRFQDLNEKIVPGGKTPLEGFNLAVEDLGNLFNDLFGDDPINYTGESITSLGDSAAGSARYLGLLAEHTRESSDAAADLTDNARLAKAQLTLLQDQIDGRKSFIDLQIQLRDNAEKINTLSEDFKKGKITAEDYYLGVASSALDSKGAVADYVSTVDAIPETQKLELTATLDPASPGAIVNQIQGSLDSHVFQVRTETARENRSPLNGGTGGNGGPGGNGGVTVVVNAPVGANLHEAGKQVHDALQAYYRNGGPQ